MRLCLVVLSVALGGGLVAAEGAPPVLSLPIACEPGRTCFIQSHVDIDPGAGASDFMCGSATYDGHKGVDFRLLSAAAVRDGVAVLAAADGTVKGVRDGMADDFPDAQERALIAGRECGNGVVIDHGEGWETQYCHMLNGSLAVRSGDRVQRGTRLGSVGYSGLAELAHVHLSVRRDGKVVDPFTGKGIGETCFRDAGTAMSGTLWDAGARQAFGYLNGEVIGAGFASRVVGHAELEVDHNVTAPEPRSPILIFYGRLMNLRAGDRVRISVTGPGGFDVQSLSKPLDRSKATYLAYGGKRLTAERWPPGRYTGAVELVRGDAVVAARRDVVLQLD